jgi:sterol desaturase/sphingolipid hydroxylase (fatty acid hydroxylase superfamily)
MSLVVDLAHRVGGAASQLFATVQQTLFEAVVQPLLFAIGASTWVEDAFDATGWLLLGGLQIVILLALIGPLQRLWPVEPVQDRRAIGTDVVYTLIHRLGLFRLALFFSVDPLANAAFGWLALHGVRGWQLDQLAAPLWPGVTDTALAAFMLYLVVFDAADYALHRAQHRYAWWWALHAVHHSQRQMTMWSDNRNHFLDDLIRDALLVLLAQAIGVPPSQFVAVVVFTHLVESLSHANLRLRFGAIGERLLVSPRFHRVHHGIGVGDVDASGAGAGEGGIGGCNFAVLFPVWDALFGTADHTSAVGPTGILDQLPQHGARDYGRGLLAQQWFALRRLRRSKEERKICAI